MKRVFNILIPSLVAISLSANELSWVDEQIEAIKPPRVGLSTKEVAKIRDPFIFLHRSKKVESSSSVATPVGNYYVKHSRRRVYGGFSLDAILNKSALINGKWYKVNDKIHGYKIIKIGLKSVTLKRHRKIKILSTKSKKSNLKLMK